MVFQRCYDCLAEKELKESGKWSWEMDYPDIFVTNLPVSFGTCNEIGCPRYARWGENAPWIYIEELHKETRYGTKIPYQMVFLAFPITMYPGIKAMVKYIKEHHGEGKTVELVVSDRTFHHCLPDERTNHRPMIRLNNFSKSELDNLLVDVFERIDLAYIELAAQEQAKAYNFDPSEYQTTYEQEVEIMRESAHLDPEILEEDRESDLLWMRRVSNTIEKILGELTEFGDDQRIIASWPKSIANEFLCIVDKLEKGYDSRRLNLAQTNLIAKAIAKHLDHNAEFVKRTAFDEFLRYPKSSDFFASIHRIMAREQDTSIFDWHHGNSILKTYSSKIGDGLTSEIIESLSEESSVQSELLAELEKEVPLAKLHDDCVSSLLAGQWLTSLDNRYRLLQLASGDMSVMILPFCKAVEIESSRKIAHILYNEPVETTRTLIDAIRADLEKRPNKDIPIGLHRKFLMKELEFLKRLHDHKSHRVVSSRSNAAIAFLLRNWLSQYYNLAKHDLSDLIDKLIDLQDKRNGYIHEEILPSDADSEVFFVEFRNQSLAILKRLALWSHQNG